MQNGRLTREHWLQIFAILIPTLLAGSVTIGSATWYLSKNISEGRELSIAADALMTARLAADEARLSALERLDAERHAQQSQFESDMRSAITSLINSVADLRVTVASRSIHK